MNTVTTKKSPPLSVKHNCHHCGDECRDEMIRFDEQEFCCEGCSTVYQLLKENDLCGYYAIDGSKGVSPEKLAINGQFDYLDLPDITQKLISFTDGRLSVINWLIPKMHCSSCIWLLEQLHRFNPAIRSSIVNFPEKRIHITFENEKISLSELAALMTRTGYEPYISLDDIENNTPKKWNKTRLYKIGIAGFAFGNVMMFSFPEYFHLGQSNSDQHLRQTFGLLNLGLSIPVLFYCAADFFKSAWAALKGKYLNIDAPIVLALLSIFAISLYQILSKTGPGYFDSFTGAVFFMLVGRFFQDKTYAGISFERDYKSYFPVAVSVIQGESETRKPVSDLLPGDRILVRNAELIPTDSILLSAGALIDYSFVSGEAEPVPRKKGDTIYAGGKQCGQSIELEVIRQVSQSYLTQLWNNEAFLKPKEDQNKTLASRINRYFSVIVLIIATVTFLVWFFVFQKPETAFRAFTTCLLVACPCGLLLSSVFTNGNLVSLFGRNGFYPKNADAIERLAHIDTIVFDKTGTITRSGDSEVSFVGNSLSQAELVMIKTIAKQSLHPLSRAIVTSLSQTASLKRRLGNFMEFNGAGIRVQWGAQTVRLGSAAWVGALHESQFNDDFSRVYLSVDQQIKGHFVIKSKYRPDLASTISKLQNTGFKTYLLSGDKPTDSDFLAAIFGDQSALLFEQKPDEKLDFISNLQSSKKRNVLMIGDGLNDSGALRQSDVGVAVSDDSNHFSPACDFIIEGKQLNQLPAYIELAKSGQTIIKSSFAISLVYNIAGLSLAIGGALSPVVAAILMPVSLISIVGFTTLASKIASRKIIKN